MLNGRRSRLTTQRDIETKRDVFSLLRNDSVVGSGGHAKCSFTRWDGEGLVVFLRTFFLFFWAFQSGPSRLLGLGAGLLGSMLGHMKERFCLWLRGRQEEVVEAARWRDVERWTDALIANCTVTMRTRDWWFSR